jgi:hypothetical protein
MDARRPLIPGVTKPRLSASRYAPDDGRSSQGMHVRRWTATAAID